MNGKIKYEFSSQTWQHNAVGWYLFRFLRICPKKYGKT